MSQYCAKDEESNINKLLKKNPIKKSKLMCISKKVKNKKIKKKERVKFMYIFMT